MSPATIHRLDDHRPIAGPPDWPTVRERCGRGEWQAAYGAARGDAEAVAYIEDRKAEEIAALVAAWRERRAANGNP